MGEDDLHNSGWIMVHRKIENSWIYSGKPFDKCHAWLDLLIHTNHSDKKINADGKPYLVKRGQYITSIKILSERWGWSRNKVKRFLDVLEADNMVITERTNRWTSVTVVNYSVYQTSCKLNEPPNELPDEPPDEPPDELADGHQMNHQMNHKQELNNVNNDKNEKNEKNINTRACGGKPKSKKPVYFPNDELLNEAFESFIEMRNKIKKPMTDRAIDLAIKKLKDFATIQSTGEMDNELAIKIINQSIFNNWQGLYELKDNNGWVNRNNTSRNNAGYDWDNI